MALEQRRSVASGAGVCGWAEKEEAAAAVALDSCSAAVFIDKKYLLISLSPAAASGQDPARLVETTIVCYECECVVACGCLSRCATPSEAVWLLGRLSAHTQLDTIKHTNSVLLLCCYVNNVLLLGLHVYKTDELKMRICQQNYLEP